MIAKVKNMILGTSARQARQPRRYLVPRGLTSQVARMMDATKGPGRCEAKVKLWRLLGDRCPETREGNGELSFQGEALYLVEMPGDRA